MSEKLDKGKEGEEYAVKYLIDKGFKIIDRNFNSLNSEIDIICSKGDMLVFVEVRLKISPALKLELQFSAKFKLLIVNLVAP